MRGVVCRVRASTRQAKRFETDLICTRLVGICDPDGLVEAAPGLLAVCPHGILGVLSTISGRRQPVRGLDRRDAAHRAIGHVDVHWCPIVG